MGLFDRIGTPSDAPINCPRCGTRMEKHHERGETIDLCPNRNCGGTFFDGGELQRFMANVTSMSGFRVPTQRPQGYHHGGHGHHHGSSSDRRRGGYHHHGSSSGHRRGGFLDDFFD